MEQTVATLLRARRDALVIGCEALLASRGNHERDAPSLIRELLRAPDADEDELKRFWKALEDAGCGLHLIEVFEKECATPGLAPVLGALWARASASRWRMGACRRLLPKLAAQGAIGARATSAYVELLGERKLGLRFRWFVWRNREYLRSDVGVWASVGYVLLQFRRYRGLAEWMADWGEREGVRPWMLQNLVLALRSLGRDEEARSIGRRALEMAQPEEDVQRHRIWIAVDAALAGDVETARTELAATSDLESVEYFRFLRHVTRAAIAAVASDVVQEDEKQLALARAAVPGFGAFPALKFAYRRAVRFIADRRGGLSGLLFRMSGLHRP